METNFPTVAKISIGHIDDFSIAYDAAYIRTIAIYPAVIDEINLAVVSNGGEPQFPASVVEEVRWPGGWLPRRPIIYVDKKGNPIDLDEVEKREVNKAVQKAKQEVKSLKGEDKADAKEALRELQNAAAAHERDEMIAAARELSEYVSAMGALVEVLQQIERDREDEEEAIAMLLLS